jgi:hypothetical protein
VPRYKLGTNRITQHHPTLTNINRHLRRPRAVLDAKALVRIFPAALHQQTQPDPTKTMPSPGGQTSGMASYEHCCGRAGVGRVGHPADLPEGYHALPQGQA